MYQGESLTQIRGDWRFSMSVGKHPLNRDIICWVVGCTYRPEDKYVRTEYIPKDGLAPIDVANMLHQEVKANTFW